MNKLEIKNQKNPSLKDIKDGNQVFGTAEWASRTVNYISGCSHDCKYCYAKSMAIRFKRKAPRTWKIEEVNLKKLNNSFKKKNGYTMFPSSHDITPENLDYSLEFLERLLNDGHQVLVVTKPHLLVVETICDKFAAYKDSILFRFTIGSCNSKILKFWEPGAPSFEERLTALQHAHSLGFKTSVSAEPAIDTNTEQLIETLLPIVTDAIWIGLPNRLKGILKLNGANDPETLERADALLKAQSDDWVRELYYNYKDNPKIKWKDSIKKIIGIERPTLAGLDI